MMHALAQWVVSAIFLLIAAYFVPGFQVAGFGTALIAALVIGVFNATVWWVIFIFTLPINVLTLGLFTFVVNAIILKLAAAFAPGFAIKGWTPALIAALVLAVENAVFRLFFSGNK